MATASKLPSGNWRARGFQTIDGKRVGKSFTAPTKKEALFLAVSWEQEGKVFAASSDPTVGEALQRYIDNRQGVLSPSTIYGYSKYKKLYMQSIINVKLSQLTRDMVQRAVSADSKTHSPKTVRNAYGAFASACKAAGCDVFTADLPRKEYHEMAIPAEDKILAIYDEVRGTWMEIVLILGASCGLRRSEMCALTVDDVKDCKIRIRKAKVDSLDGWTLKTPKTFAGYRDVDIAPEEQERILALASSSGPLLPVVPRTVSTRWNALAIRHGIPDVHLHSLRHYHASVLLAMGFPDKYAMKRLGQSTNSTLKNVYQHIVKDIEQDLTQKLLSQNATRKATRI